MLPADEGRLSALIVEAYPHVRFIDGTVWLSAEPPSFDSIDECTSRVVSIWDAERFPSLPTHRRADGRYEGPTVGPVIQVIRSRLHEAGLSSGRVAAGSDAPDPVHLHFLETVFRALRGCTLPVLSKASGKRASNVRVGPAAAAWAKEGNILLHESTFYQYLPEK